MDKIKYNKHMQDMISILLVYSVQWVGPPIPHWAIYYISAIVRNINQVVIYVKRRFYNHTYSYALGRQKYQLHY